MRWRLMVLVEGHVERDIENRRLAFVLVFPYWCTYFLNCIWIIGGALRSRRVDRIRPISGSRGRHSVPGIEIPEASLKGVGGGYSAHVTFSCLPFTQIVYPVLSR